jgi:hypothetical protein
MRLFFAFLVAVILLGAYPPTDSKATGNPPNQIGIEVLKDSIIKLRHYADSQSISNVIKMQELQIAIIEFGIKEKNLLK